MLAKKSPCVGKVWRNNQSFIYVQFGGDDAIALSSKLSFAIKNLGGMNRGL
jgi:hypothetical protein